MNITAYIEHSLAELTHTSPRVYRPVRNFCYKKRLKRGKLNQSLDRYHCINMEIVKTAKGGVKICLNGYMYVKKYTTAKQIRWNCVKSRLDGCKGTLVTDKEMGNPKETVPHDHPTDEKAIEVTKTKLQMKRKVAESVAVNPVQVYSDVISSINDEDVLGQLPTETVCKQMIRREKRRNLPKEPKHLNELIIEGKWKDTSETSGKRFLLKDNECEGGRRVIVFATDDGIERLGSARE